MWQNEDTPGLQGCPTPLRVHDFWKRPRKKCRNRCEAPSSAGKAPTSRSEIELCIGSSKKSRVTKWTGKRPTKGASVGAAVWWPPTWKRRLLRDYVSSKFMHASKWQTWWQERFLMSVGTCKLTTWQKVSHAISCWKCDVWAPPSNPHTYYIWNCVDHEAGKIDYYWQQDFFSTDSRISP